MSIGASDGTDDRYVSISSNDAEVTTGTFHRSNPASCLGLILPAASTEDGAVSHNSFIAGGQRVDNDNGASSARLVNHMFFKCEFASLLTATLDTAVDTAVNVDPGFNWDALITFGACRGATANGDEAEIYLGFFDRTNQGCIAFNSADGQTDGDPSLQISTTYCGMEMALGTGALDYGVDASVGSGTSCDLTPRNAGGDGDAVFCLFLGWTSAESASVFSWTSPTATGADAQTGLGFQPQALLNLFSFAASYDTAEADADGGAFAIGMETGDSQFCAGISDEFNSATTDSQSMIDNQAINVELDTGAAGDVATLTSLDADGFTHNYSGVEGTANRMLTLAFEVAASNTATPHIRERLFI
jgi:hypothetical protein